MKILLLSSEVVPERAGGIGSYVATIAPALAARGHEVHVLSCAPEHDRRDDLYGGAWWHRRRLLGGDRVSTLDLYRQTALRLATAASCRKELHQLGMRFDVIESPEWLAESLFIGSTTRVPIVMNLHTPLHILFKFDVARFGRDLRFADFLERAAMHRARIITSTSYLLAESLRADGWLRKTPRIIPYPVDVDARDDGTSVLESPPVILSVGRLEPRKAPELVVEAAEILAPEVPGLQLVFVGRSRGYREGRPYAEWVGATAERKGVNARFVPQTSHHEIHELYAAARVVAVPSHFESFSIAALEAMAAGRPVVYSSRIGAAEVLRENSAAGTEVPPNDPQALAAALRPYLVDPHLAANAGSAARELARTRCSPDIIAGQRERCFEEAVA